MFPPDCWDPPATSSHARKCLTVGTHLVKAYVALSFWSRTCTYIYTVSDFGFRETLEDNAMYASTRWVPTVRHFLACEDVAGGSQQSGGRIVLFFFARTHFLVCEGVAGGSQKSRGKHFFHEIRWPIRWVPAVTWRNNYFARNKEALP